MARSWYKYGTARVRISTTVDESLLATARRVRSGLADSALIDEALIALVARNRAAEVYTNPDLTAGTYPPPQVIAADGSLALRIGENEVLTVPMADVLP